MERAAEQLAPQRVPELAAQCRVLHGSAVAATRVALDASPAPPELHAFAERFAAAFTHIVTAFECFSRTTDAPPMHRITEILAALHHAAAAQECFYPLRQALSDFTDYWSLPDTHAAPDPPLQRASDGSPLSGVVHVSAGARHGGFSLYVPETYTSERDWPLIVALHGGSGNGRDFLWTWVREAKSLGYIVVAPKAVGNTWSEVEDAGLLEIIGWLRQRYHLAANSILLTGLSDGATFTLLYGLAHPEIYRALAPLCGVLHPASANPSNLALARNVPIYLVHGAQDFLFPVELARLARDMLQAAGAALVYRELPELSHTYPRSENVRILRWFESLPAASA